MRVYRVRFSDFKYIINATKLRKIATLAETGNIEEKLATRVRKSVLILAANYKYKLRILFFAHFVSRICSIHVSPFCTQRKSILHYNPQLSRV